MKNRNESGSDFFITLYACKYRKSRRAPIARQAFITEVRASEYFKCDDANIDVVRQNIADRRLMGVGVLSITVPI